MIDMSQRHITCLLGPHKTSNLQNHSVLERCDVQRKLIYQAALKTCASLPYSDDGTKTAVEISDTGNTMKIPNKILELWTFSDFTQCIMWKDPKSFLLLLVSSPRLSEEPFFFYHHFIHVRSLVLAVCTTGWASHWPAHHHCCVKTELGREQICSCWLLWMTMFELKQIVKPKVKVP